MSDAGGRGTRDHNDLGLCADHHAFSTLCEKYALDDSPRVGRKPGTTPPEHTPLRSKIDSGSCLLCSDRCMRRGARNINILLPAPVPPAPRPGALSVCCANKLCDDFSFPASPSRTSLDSPGNPPPPALRLRDGHVQPRRKLNVSRSLFALCPCTNPQCGSQFRRERLFLPTFVWTHT